MLDKVVKVFFFPNNSKNLRVICVLGTIVAMGLVKKVYESENRIHTLLDEGKKKTEYLIDRTIEDLKKRG